MPSVAFSVRCDRTQWGQSVGVLGSWNGWDKTKVTPLTTSASTFPVWTASVPLPSRMEQCAVHYKYVILSQSHINQWETDSPVNRVFILPPGGLKLDDIFSQIPTSPSRPSPTPLSSWSPASKPLPHFDPRLLDPVDRSLVHLSHKHRSWRLRLIHVRSLLADPVIASSIPFDVHDIHHVAALAVYLSFLSAGQVACDEDGGHHRPNHLAREAAIIDNRLAALAHSPLRQTHPAFPHVLRKIPPLLPSYSPQFTVSVPLTRIRDIAHRSDIPRDVKLDIKHNLQNKLHRNAGPEDLHTSARILDTISHGDFSPTFVEQFRIFHSELQAFFNAASLDDRLHYLQNSPRVGQSVAAIAAELCGLKHSHGDSLHQLRAITRLRAAIAESDLLLVGVDDHNVTDEDAQKVRLADIDLENYAFVQLAAEAQRCEEQQASDSPHDFAWSRFMEAAALSMDHMRLSQIRPPEALATSAELHALSCTTTDWSSAASSCAVLRAKAAVERAMRFAQEFSDGLVEVYGKRAKSLGEALGVEQHAVEMFGEAEIRAHTSFQMSRVTATLGRMCRQALGQSAWDAVHTGRVRGRVIYGEGLSDIREKMRVITEGRAREDVIAVVRAADGDEDVPLHVVGVVNGRGLAHLSHLGVRARQADVVFVCAEDGDCFDRVWEQGLAGRRCELDVTTREGLRKLEPVVGADGAAGKEDASEVKSEEEEEEEVATGVSEECLRFDGMDSKVVGIAQASKLSMSSKCMFAGRLLQIATDSDGLFDAPDGIGVPHGAFQAELRKHIADYDALVRAYDASEAGADEKADGLRTFVEARFDAAHVAGQVVKHFMQGDRVMVRSSANAEDLEHMSGAGLYDSFANVDAKDVEQVAKMIRKVWGSVWTRRAASSRRACQVEHSSVSMAVLVQRMVKSRLSFVALSQEPGGLPGDIVVELARGMGETLASGRVKGLPYRLRISRECWEVEDVCLASFSDELVAAEDEEDGLREAVVDYSRERMTVDAEWRREVGRRIGRVVQTVEEALDGPQDVEGAVVVGPDDGDVRIWVVQARAQTG